MYRYVSAVISHPGLSAHLLSMQGAEVEVCEGFLLLVREDEGLGGRRQDWLESSEFTVKVAHIH